MYADDSEHTEEVAANLSAAMENILLWLNESCLVLNVEKTAMMFFTNKQKHKDDPNISIRGEIVKNVTEFRYLV